MEKNDSFPMKIFWDEKDPVNVLRPIPPIEARFLLAMTFLFTDTFNLIISYFRNRLIRLLSCFLIFFIRFLLGTRYVIQVLYGCACALCRKYKIHCRTVPGTLPVPNAALARVLRNLSNKKTIISGYVQNF